MIIPSIWKKLEKYNSCSKPPTSYCMSMVSGDCAQPSVSSVSSVGMWEKQPSHPERLHGSCGGVTACAVQHEWATRVWSKRGIHKLSPTSHSTVYLVGGWPTPLKNMSSSVGMMTFFQTTNQYNIIYKMHSWDELVYSLVLTQFGGAEVRPLWPISALYPPWFLDVSGGVWVFEMNVGE